MRQQKTAAAPLKTNLYACLWEARGWRTIVLTRADCEENAEALTDFRALETVEKADGHRCAYTTPKLLQVHDCGPTETARQLTAAIKNARKFAETSGTPAAALELDDTQPVWKMPH